MNGYIVGILGFIVGFVGVYFYNNQKLKKEDYLDLKKHLSDDIPSTEEAITEPKPIPAYIELSRKFKDVFKLIDNFSKRFIYYIPKPEYAQIIGRARYCGIYFELSLDDNCRTIEITKPDEDKITINLDDIGNDAIDELISKISIHKEKDKIEREIKKKENIANQLKVIEELS